MELHNSPESSTALQALILSRLNLVNLSTLCSTIMLVHVCFSWWLESRYQKVENVPEGERASVPRSESQRTWRYIRFMLRSTLGTFIAKVLFSWQGYGIWQRMW
jgi:dolichol kinase